MPHKKILAALFLLFLIVGTVWILRYRSTMTLRTAEGFIFGTTYHIKYEAAEPLDSQIVAELQRVDASMSVFNPRSTISRINSGASRQTDAMLSEVIKKAEEVSRATHGAFDITVMPLVNAWGFGFKSGALPTDAQVDSLRALVGYKKIHLLGEGLLKKDDPRTMLDCGAIAKGYAVDRIALLLRQRGVRNYLIEIGGEVVTKGRNPEGGGHPWQVAVARPSDDKTAAAPGGDYQTILSLENAALATSGNYRNFYVKDGRKYAHTIDPRTGRPVQHSLLSATVIAPDCATADAYATAFMVMGLEEAKALIQKDKHLKVYLIYADQKGEMQVFTNHQPRD